MRKILIVEKKLGRYSEGRKKNRKCLGRTVPAKGIAIVDPRQNEHSRLDTAVHECIHLVFPDLKEKKVIKTANRIAQALWNHGYRRVNQ